MGRRRCEPAALGDGPTLLKRGDAAAQEDRRDRCPLERRRICDRPGEGPGGALPVRLWRLNTPSAFTLMEEFFAYEPGYAGGVYVAGGN